MLYEYGKYDSKSVMQMHVVNLPELYMQCKSIDTFGLQHAMLLYTRYYLA